jgi:hypothetical protein
VISYAMLISLAIESVEKGSSNISQCHYTVF